MKKYTSYLNNGVYEIKMTEFIDGKKYKVVYEFENGFTKTFNSIKSSNAYLKRIRFLK